MEITKYQLRSRDVIMKHKHINDPIIVWILEQGISSINQLNITRGYKFDPFAYNWLI